MSRAGLGGVRGSLTLLRRGMCQKKADSALEYFYRCRNLRILAVIVVALCVHGVDPMDASNKMTFVVFPGDGSAAKARCCRGRDSLPLGAMG